MIPIYMYAEEAVTPTSEELSRSGFVNHPIPIEDSLPACLMLSTLEWSEEIQGILTELYVSSDREIEYFPPQFHAGLALGQMFLSLRWRGGNWFATLLKSDSREETHAGKRRLLNSVVGVIVAQHGKSIVVDYIKSQVAS